MSSSVKMLKPILAELSVTVSKEDVAKAIDKAFALVSRSARVRGFRKGKAPRSVLQRLYGDAILQDVQGEIINTHLLQALLENELDPISQPQLDLSAVKKGEEYSFKATFEIRPKIETVDYSDIEVERLKIAVKEEDIAEELKRIQGALASVSDLPEPRPAAKGDVVKVALKRWVDGEWQDSAGLPEQEIVIGEGQAPAQIDEALVGMNVDEEKVVDMGSPDEVEENRTRYMITVKAVKERKLPEIDDEMAKDTGKYDSLDALKADIEKHILDRRNQNEDQRMRSTLFKKLMEKNPMELPPSLVDRHAQALKQQLFGQMMSQMSEEQSADMLQTLEEGTRKSAEEMVHQHLLTMEIARIEDIKVEEDEIEKEIETRANAAGIPVPMLKAELNKENRRQEFSIEILERKIFDFAKSSVKITEVDELSVDEAAEAAADSAEDKEEKETKTTKTATNKTAAKKSATKKTATKKTATKKADTKKPAAKKAPAKKTAAKKTAAKKKTTKKAADKEE